MSTIARGRIAHCARPGSVAFIRLRAQRGGDRCYPPTGANQASARADREECSVGARVKLRANSIGATGLPASCSHDRRRPSSSRTAPVLP